MKRKYKCQATWAYHSGCLTAKLHNTYYSRSDLPNVLLCMKEFQILKTLFGKYYNLMKMNKYCIPYILKYEEFNRLDLNKEFIGNHLDFMLGYSDIIKRELL